MSPRMVLVGVASLVLGTLSIAGCADADVSGPPESRSTFASVAGTVLEPGQGGVGDVQVTIVQAGQDCQEAGDSDIVSQTVASDGEGLFVVSVEDRDGFRGAGCARLDLGLPDDLDVMDPDDLVVSVIFFTTSPPPDTAQVTIEVVRSGGS